MRREPGAICGRWRGGWLLIEILVVLILFAAFGLLSAKLFVATTRTAGGAERAQGEIARFDAAVTHLRRDAWGASGIDADGGAVLRLRGAAGGDVTWQVLDGGVTLERTAGGDTRRFEAVGQAVQFEAAPASAVLIAAPTDAGAQEARIRIVSQVLVAEAMR